MKPSEYAKEQGLKSLKIVADEVDLPRIDTLYNWWRSRQKMCKALIKGVAAITKERDGWIWIKKSKLEKLMED